MNQDVDIIEDNALVIPDEIDQNLESERLRETGHVFRTSITILERLKISERYQNWG